MLSKPTNRIRSVSRIQGVGRSLAIRRTWYADDDVTGKEGQQEKAQTEKQFATVDEAAKYAAALEKRLAERDATIDDLKTQVKTVSGQMTEFSKAQKKQLEEQGNFKELAQQREAEVQALTPYKERAATLEQIIRESNEARVAKIPETMRALVPIDYAPERLQSWLNANETLLTKPPAPNFDAGAGGTQSGQGVQLTSGQKAMAKAMGMSEADYAKQLGKISS